MMNTNKSETPVNPVYVRDAYTDEDISFQTMPNFYYYNENGDKISVTGEHLKRLAENRHITPDTIIENEAGKKAPAGKVKGLTFVEVKQPESTKSAKTETYVVAPPASSVSANSDAFGAAISAAMNNLTSSPLPAKSNTFQTESYTFTAAEQAESKGSHLITVIGIIAVLVGGIGWRIIKPTAPKNEQVVNVAPHVIPPAEQKPPPAMPVVGQTEIDRFCAKYGNDVKAVDIEGDSLLHRAADYKDQTKTVCWDVSVAEFLVSQGANIDARRSDGVTPLVLAVRSRNFDVVKFLISKGADVNVNNGFRNATLLHEVARKGDIELVQLLISKGANVNARGDGLIQGGTPLHDAVAAKKYEVFKYLVSVGGDVYVKSVVGWTPLDIIVRDGGLVNEFLDIYPAAEQGNPVAQHNLGVYYFDRGKYGVALHWFRMAAEQGAVPSYAYAGMCFKEMHDDREAVKWFQIGAEKGDANAQFILGTCYVLGSSGVAKDFNEGKRWIQRSAARGNRQAIETLRTWAMQGL
jgi:hypothetical protein